MHVGSIIVMGRVHVTQGLLVVIAHVVLALIAALEEEHAVAKEFVIVICCIKEVQTVFARRALLELVFMVMEPIIAPLVNVAVSLAGVGISVIVSHLVIRSVKMVEAACVMALARAQLIGRDLQTAAVRLEWWELV